MATDLLAKTAEKSVYMQVADDPLGQIFLLLLFAVVPVLCGIGAYHVHAKWTSGDGNKWVGIGVGIGWLLILWILVDVQMGRLVTE
jgi:hypothetical protein